MHTGFGLCGCAPGGEVPAHVHSYEESVLRARRDRGPRRARRLVPARAGRLRRCSRSASRTPGATSAEARPRAGRTCSRRCRGRATGTTRRPCPTCRRGRARSTSTSATRAPGGFGHIEPAQMDSGQADPGPARGLGEHAHRAARLQRDHREDDGRHRPRRAAVDDVHGAVRAGRRRRRARPPVRGDLPVPRGRGRGRASTARRTGSGPATCAWAGVGCVHGFRNAGDGPLRWLETQAPQPPARHSYRFARDWEYLRDGSSAEVDDGDGGIVVVGGTSGIGREIAQARAPSGATRSSSPAATPVAPPRSPASSATRPGVALDLAEPRDDRRARWPASARSTTWCSRPSSATQNTVRRLRHRRGARTWSR